VQAAHQLWRRSEQVGPCPLTTHARAHSHMKCWSEGAVQLTWNRRCCSRAADHALGRLPPLAAGGQAQPRHAPCSAHASPYSQHCTTQRAAQAVGSARSLAQPLGYCRRERKANHLPGSAESLHPHVHKHSCELTQVPIARLEVWMIGYRLADARCWRGYAAGSLDVRACTAPGLESPQRSRNCPGCRRAEPELVPVLTVDASLSLCLCLLRLSMQSPAARLPVLHPAGEPALHSRARDSASAPAGAQVRRTSLQHGVAYCRNSARCHNCLAICRTLTVRTWSLQEALGDCAAPAAVPAALHGPDRQAVLGEQRARARGSARPCVQSAGVLQAA